ncbi:hypothetical protein BD413DRAFT_515734 [Trametes elegans]|nr:hypothetical protein BD413DRAFT_515734 [Trametes elegans]
MYRMRDSGFSTLTRTEDGTVIRTARASSILDPHLLGTLGEMKTMQSVVPDVPALPQV